MSDEPVDRLGFLVKYLKDRVGRDPFPFSELDKDSQEAGHGHLSVASWKGEITNVKPLLPDLNINYPKEPKDTIRVSSKSDYDLEWRRQHRPKTKAKLGKALWCLVFGSNVFQTQQKSHGTWASEKLLPNKLSPNSFGGPAKIWGPLLKRLESMRSSGTPALWLDAGSTNEKLSEQLENLDDLNGADVASPRVGAARPVELRPRLRIVTTSLKVASTLAESRHKHNLELFFVGGQLWPRYMSAAGPITIELLSYFRQQFNNSIAVVGATGYRFGKSTGGSSLLCTSQEEMFAKDALLRNAAFRIAIFDSTKLEQNYLPRVFAPLRALDLVVIDNGEHMSDPQKRARHVKELCDEAHALGVATWVIPAEQD